MFFRKNKAEEKAARTRQKLEKLNEEISEIWNGDNDEVKSDVNGSYTGNPQGFEVPEQDADDL